MRTKYLVLFLVVFMSSAVNSQEPTWKEFSSPEGRFSVLLPGTPTKTTQKVNSDLGVITLYLFTFNQENISYNVTCSDYPESIFKIKSIDKFLDDYRDGAVAGVRGKLVSETKISLGTYPGREVIIEVNDGRILACIRFYMVKTRLYQVSVATQKENPQLTNVTRFLESFKLLEK